MYDYIRFYKKYGVFKIRDMLTPNITLGVNFALPRNSILHWSKVSSIQETINSSVKYLNNDIVLVNIGEYGNKITPMGKYKFSSAKFNKASRVTSKGKEAFKVSQLAKNTTTKHKSDVLVLLNYNTLVVSNVYQPHPMNDYYKIINGLSLALTNVNINKSRHNFILIDLPNTMPSLSVVRRHLMTTTRSTLREFPELKQLVILELVKFINESSHSVFDILETGDALRNVTMLFTINENVIPLNMYRFRSMLKYTKEHTDLVKYSGEIIIKLFLVFINNLIINPNGISASDIVTSDIVHNDISSTASMEELADLDELLPEDEEIGEVDSALPEDIMDELNHQLSEDSLDMSESEFRYGNAVTDNTDIMTRLDIKLKNGEISKRTHTTFKEHYEVQMKSPNPYGGEGTLGDFLAFDKDEFTVDADEVKLAKPTGLADDRYAKDTLGVLDRKYMKVSYKRDILRMIYGVQNSGRVILNHEITSEESILGGQDTHKITILNSNGVRSTIQLKLNRMDEDGVFKNSGNEYRIRKQRGDVNIRKVDHRTVRLSSYYGKLSVVKAKFKRNDFGFVIYRNLLRLRDEGLVSRLIDGNTPKHDIVSDVHYSKFSRYIKSFNYKGISFSFDYNDRVNLLNYDKSLEVNATTVGYREDKTILLSDDGILYENSPRVELGNIYTFLEMDPNKFKVEYCEVGVYGNSLPVVVVLASYMGLDNLIDKLNLSLTKIPRNKRVEKGDNLVIVFSNIKYVIKRDNGVGDMLFGGLVSMSKIIKDLSSDVLNKVNMLPILWTALELNLATVNKLNSIRNLFVDPVTYSVLKLNNLPVTISGLLLKATELLVDDNYKNPNHISGSVFRGNERISGFIYKTLSDAIEADDNRSHFGKSKLKVNPYEVVTAVGADNTTVLVDDVNPVATAKQVSDVTFLGSGGRSEITMTTETRALTASDIGIMSEGTKDNGAVGISGYMSATPKLMDTRGTPGDLDFKEDGWSSVLSDSAMLAPYGIHDNPVRLNFAGTQNSHIIPFKEMRPSYIMTSYELIFPMKVSSKFVRTALADGIINKVKDGEISLTYENSDEITKYRVANWTSKEEGGVCYTHKMVVNFKEGNKFNKGDSLIYDTTFFEPLIFNTNVVIYRPGTHVVMAAMEDPGTYEDSGVVSERLSNIMSTEVTKVVDKIIAMESTVRDIVSVGDKLIPTDKLMVFVDDGVSMYDGMDERTKEILSDISSDSSELGYSGTVTNVIIYYNCELSEVSESLMKVIKLSDERLLRDTGFTGKVDSGLSINGTPLQAGEVAIKFYITTTEIMGTASKGVVGTQLKFTTGEVFKGDVLSEDGTSVDFIFSTRSSLARLTNSNDFVSVGSMFLHKLGEKVTKDFFN